MSLINRMLRDLSSRQPPAGNVMSGIQLPGAAAPARSNALGKLGALVVLVAVFTGGLWLVFGPKPVKIPQPRQAPAGAIVAEPAEAPSATDTASAADTAKLKMDTTLSNTGAAAPAPVTPAAPATAPSASEPGPPKVASKPRAKPAPTAPVAPTEHAATPVTSRATRTPQAAEVYAQARRALERGDEKAGEALLLDTLALDPGMHGAREDLGNLRVSQGRYDEAEANARAGLELDPAYVGYRRLIARLELARGRPAAAVDILERDPPGVERDIEYHALLASGYQRLGRHEDASRRYQDLLRQQPDEPLWWAGFGLSRDALGDAAGAVAAYARARQLGNLDPRVLEHINQRSLALQSGD